MFHNSQVLSSQNYCTLIGRLNLAQKARVVVFLAETCYYLYLSRPLRVVISRVTTLSCIDSSLLVCSLNPRRYNFLENSFLLTLISNWWTALKRKNWFRMNPGAVAEGGDDGKQEPPRRHSSRVNSTHLTAEELIAAAANSKMASALQNTRAYLKLPVAVVFLGMLIAVLIVHNDGDASHQIENYMIQSYVADGTDAVNADTTLKFINIGTHGDVTAWLLDTFFTADLWRQFTNNGEPLGGTYTGQFLLVLGGVRITQGLSYPQKCEGDNFGDLVADCHYEASEYDPPSDWEEEGFIPTGFTLEEAHEYVNTNLTDSVWLSKATKWIELDVTAFSAELRRFVTLQIRIDFQRSGFLEPSYTASSIPSEPYHRGYVIALDVIFLAAFGLQVVLEAKEFVEASAKGRRGFRGYISDGWNQVDVACIVTLLVIIWLWVDLVLGVANLNASDVLEAGQAEATGDGGDPGGGLQANDVSSSALATQGLVGKLVALGITMQRIRTISSICLLLSMLRLLKYFSFQPRLSLLTETMRLAIPDLSHFLMLFLLVFLSYSVIGLLLFGGQIEGFKTLWGSSIMCFTCLMGDFNFQEMDQINTWGAHIFFVSFMVVVFLLLLNILLAIVMDAYADAKSSVGDTNTVLQDLIDITLSWLDGLRAKRAGKRVLDEDAVKLALEQGDLKDCAVTGDIHAKALASQMGVDPRSAANFLKRMKRNSFDGDSSNAVAAAASAVGAAAGSLSARSNGSVLSEAAAAAAARAGAEAAVAAMSEIKAMLVELQASVKGIEEELGFPPKTNKNKEDASSGIDSNTVVDINKKEDD